MCEHYCEHCTDFRCPYMDREEFQNLEKTNAELEAKALQYDFEKAQKKQIDYVLRFLQFSAI